MMESSSFTVKELERGLLTDMYLTFLDSFSDYEIPFRLAKDQFVKKFVEKLKIDFDLSAGVFDTSQGLAGFVFTTINEYNGLKTAYNGGTGVRPRYRGHKLVSVMYDFLIPKFIQAGVKQCILEVLVNNTKAIGVYKNIGFTTTTRYKCFKLEPHYKFADLPRDYLIRKVTSPDWACYGRFMDAKTSFLDSKPMIDQNLANETVVEVHFNFECVGYAIYQPALGRISQIAIDPAHRGKGVGKGLVHYLVQTSKNKALTIMNVAAQYKDLTQFFEHVGFKNQLDQYEMMLGL